ncbi:hypothetical protein CAPTEDRAFT_168004 [Capitella teleta]|uniref:Uncharacterized protein n=1 Tax=Capitella teleta TaxID=283909 RepID=R7UFC3_CAPTE|nr:hypothetical protein CAPTEDRAFT_168004 [Capitella teleta]|eukprot:ELU04920.1 hypothetical protein CAPTEDRAFT_168004 [Capitella teleta]
MSAYCIECNRVWKSGCPQHIHTYTHVPDSPVYSRAITTLPSILQLQRSNDPTAPYIVMANVDIEARTVFGPLEGKRLTGVTDHHGDDPHHWQIYQSQGTQVIDCTDEAVSNWLMFLQRATRNSDQNIVAYQHGSDVYFVCRQKISAGETLQYWFSSDYAQLLGVGQSPEPTYSCSQCQREFDSIKLLNNHVARVHQESSSFKPHICGVCSKAFLTASKLKEHCVTHSGERPHQCPTCAKTFALPSNLKMHLRLHSNEKEFACKVCDKTFTQRAHLENHLLSHTKLKRHECQYCLMKFARPYDLRSHINCVHLKEKSYPCAECSSVFYKPQALKRHVARHVEKKRFKYKCSKCCMEFRGKGNLNRHFPKCNEVVELKQTEEKSWIIFK